MEGFFENQWAFWLLVPALALLAVEVFFRKRPFWLALPRSLWIAGIILLIANYKFVQSREYSDSSTVRVFFDLSDSVMRLDERADRMRTVYEEFKAWAKERKQPIEYYAFAQEVSPMTGDRWPKLPYSERTSLAPLFQLPQAEVSNVLVSDGNFPEQRAFSQDSYAIQIGNEDEKDIWIEEAPPVLTAFLKNRVQFQVLLRQSGFTGSRVELLLKRGGEIVSKQEVEFTGESQPVELSYFPERMGEEILELQVEGPGSELSTLNNWTSIRLRTVRDKIRVLHICGKPSLDLKAWRLFLTRQPDVDLVSFYILRSLDDDPMAKNDELSLIPFPYEELFTTELEKFDVVILQNFNFNLYFQPFYLRNLANFVQAGGALLMMGGDQSFQNYRRSPIESFLPFDFASGAQYQEGDFRAGLVQDHPIVEGLDWVFSRPNWNSRHNVHIRPDASTLAQFKDGIPLLAFSEMGEGRVLILNTDESWKLQFQNIGDYVPFNRVARRFLQFLTFDPEMEARRLISSDWNVGQEVELRLSGDQVSDWEILKADENWEYQNQSVIKFKIPEPGVYEVRVSSLGESHLFETEQKPWLSEWKHLRADSERLKKTAELSGGKFFSFENRSDLWDQPLSGRQLIASESSSWSVHSLWLSWAALIAILSLLCLDFFLRKKYQWDA